MDDAKTLSKQAIRSILKSIISSLKNVKLSQKKEVVNELNVYWTYTGILATDADNVPAIYMHNNGSVFIFERGGTRVGICANSYLKSLGWEMSFLEMQHSILVRAIMKDSDIPDMRKLIELYTEQIARYELLKKDILWITA